MSHPHTRQIRYDLEFAGVVSRLFDVLRSSTLRHALVESTGLDLGDSESRCVWQLALTPGIRAAELATRLDLGAPGVSKIVAKLQARGILIRSPDETDARAYSLHLTDLGATVAQRLFSSGDEMIGSVLAAWDPADVQQLTDLADRFVTGAESYVARRSAPSAP